MTTEHAKIMTQALELPTELRAELAEQLLSTLDGAQRHEIDAAWAAEAERRIDDYDSGLANATPGDEVFRSIRERLKQ